MSFTKSDNPVVYINKTLNTFFEKYPQEKVYIQFDRKDYETSDTIWYKGYVTYNHAPSPLSKILYVEMVDNNGYIIKRQTLPIDDGGAEGDIALNEKFHPGQYHIRAYTSWMMNFDQAFYFRNDINIGEIDSTANQNSINDLSNVNVEFFPEGGNLVEGINEFGLL